MERKVGLTPPVKVVVAATVGSEDTPEAISESGTADGSVDARVKVRVGVERVPGAEVAAAALVAAAEVAAAEVVAAAAAAESWRAWWWTSRAAWAETSAGRARAGRRANFMAGK